MPTYTVRFYDQNPGGGNFTNTVGGISTYNGPAVATGIAVIDDADIGAGAYVLTDDNGSGVFDESGTTGNVTVDGDTSFGGAVQNERTWTVQDTVTLEIFEVVMLRVIGGDAAGRYTLSEVPLVVGRDYETLAHDGNPGNNPGDANFSFADYDASVNDVDVVSGDGTDNTIDVDYTGDPEGDMVDSSPAPTALNLSWIDDFGGDGDNLEGANAAVDVGGIEVTVTITDDGGLDVAEVDDDDNSQYVAGGEPFDPDSSLFLDGGAGSTQTATTTIEFASVTGSGFEDMVQNVTFRLNDVDIGSWTDIIRVRAYDENGNEIEVVLTADGDDTIGAGADSNQVTGVGSDNPDEIGGSVLVEIAGPVARIEIDYDNSAANSQQWAWVTDIHFEAVAEGSWDDIVKAGDGDDTIDAGHGSDTVFGEGGDDTIYVGSGDIAVGDYSAGDGVGGNNNDGDDTFIINPDQLIGGGGAIAIHGGEADDDSDYDILDFNGQLVLGSIVYTETDDAAGGLSGYGELLDGTIVTFTGIEEIICFARGTNILTDRGEVAIEDLQPGQMVATLDHGMQPLRWIGSRVVLAETRLAPIVMRAGVLGNTRDLRVSPQHRMLIRGAQAQLLFGEDEVLVAAKHLTNWDGVFAETGGEVEYFHMLFDSHQIVFADGAESESFHPGTVGMGALEQAARDEVLDLFPELAADLGAYGSTARMCLKQYEARLLVH
ncbi:MAG: hypothetical protein GKR99_16110 [Rhodobacteraceae bacterium]|nr:hypothetical protein [Paracoccaceae bacterium]